VYSTAMIEGSSLEPDCFMSDAYCNGSAAAGSGNTQCLPAAKLGDALSSRSDAVHSGDACTELGEEGDLQLAAQLGKVLLQENEELRRTNQQAVQEFNEKIEVILS